MSAAIAPPPQPAPIVTVVLIADPTLAPFAGPAGRAGRPSLVTLRPTPVAVEEEVTWEDAEWR